MVQTKSFWQLLQVEQFVSTKRKFVQWEEMLLGVRGVKLSTDTDEVIGMICVEDIHSTILVVSKKGYGKTYLLE